MRLLLRSILALCTVVLVTVWATPAFAQSNTLNGLPKNVKFSCLGIDPPPSCGRSQTPWQKFADFWTGGKPVTTATKTSAVAVVPTVVTIAGPTVSTLIVNLLQSLANLPNLFSGLWINLLILFGIRKRHLPWGRVLNSVDQKPIANAAVGLYAVQSDKTQQLVDKTVTDKDGRFGFLATAGQYTVIARRPGFVFPTQIFENTYRGTALSLRADQTITIDVYGDPTELVVPWAAKLRKVLIATGWLRLPLLLLSTILSIYSLYQSVAPLNVLLVLIYAAFWGGELANVTKSRNTITIADENGKPLPFTLFKLFNTSTSAVVATKVTNRDGEAYVLVPGGNYAVQVPSPRNPEGQIVQVDLPQGVAPKHMLVKVQY